MLIRSNIYQILCVSYLFPQSLLTFVLIFSIISPTSSFTSGKRSLVIIAPLSATTSNNKEDKTKNWTYNPFDVNDLSPIDTLFRRGPVPFAVRIIRSERYEEAVLQYMSKDGVDRATAISMIQMAG